MAEDRKPSDPFTHGEFQQFERGLSARLHQIQKGQADQAQSTADQLAGIRSSIDALKETRDRQAGAKLGRTLGFGSIFVTIFLAVASAIGYLAMQPIQLDINRHDAELQRLAEQERKYYDRMVENLITQANINGRYDERLKHLERAVDQSIMVVPKGLGVKEQEDPVLERILEAYRAARDGRALDIGNQAETPDRTAGN